MGPLRKRLSIGFSEFQPTVLPAFLPGSIDLFVLTLAQAPAGDVPIRSVTIASDGSCLVAGNNKVRSALCEV